MAPPKRKRQTISIEIKKQIIDANIADSSKTQGDLVKQFATDKLTRTTDNIEQNFRDKNKILAAIEDKDGAKRAQSTTGQHSDIEDAVLT